MTCVCIVSMEDRRGCQIAQDSYSDCEPPNMGNGIQIQAHLYEQHVLSTTELSLQHLYPSWFCL